MYELRCGKYNNIKTIENIKKYNKRAIEVRDNATWDGIESSIFSGDISDNEVSTIVCALTMGDQLKDGEKDKRYCDILFFTLCVNKYSNSDNLIYNIFNAKKAFEVYGNDFEKYENMEVKEKQKYTTLDIVEYVPIGFSVKLKFPVAFFSSNGNNYCCISSKSPAYILINNSKYTLPRDLWFDLFEKDRGRIVGKTTDELKGKFNCSFNKFKEFLVLAGCERLGGIDTFIKIFTDSCSDNDIKFTCRNNKLICTILTKDKEKYRELSEKLCDNGFIKLNDFNEFVFLINDDYLVIKPHKDAKTGYIILSYGNI